MGHYDIRDATTKEKDLTIGLDKDTKSNPWEMRKFMQLDVRDPHPFSNVRSVRQVLQGPLEAVVRAGRTGTTRDGRQGELLRVRSRYLDAHRFSVEIEIKPKPGFPCLPEACVRCGHFRRRHPGAKSSADTAKRSICDAGHGSEEEWIGECVRTDL